MIENLFQQFLEHSNTLQLYLQADGKILNVSKSVVNITGMKKEELISQNWFELSRFEKSEIEAIKLRTAQFQNSNRKRKVNYIEKLYDRKGNLKWVLWNTVKTEDGKLLASGIDITKQHEQRERLKKINLNLREFKKERNESLNYAARLQKAILHSPIELKRHFKDSFIYYKPKEEVSGDIYYFTKLENYIFVAVIDCTGHGVPGAMISMIANSLLRNIIKAKRIFDPKKILQTLDNDFISYLHDQSTDFGDTILDGMDIALCRFDLKNNNLTFSGAYRPLYILRNETLQELNANKFPIGFVSGIEKTFQNEEYRLIERDRIFLFTDGYIDQFGGIKDKKYNRKRFKDLLINTNQLDAESSRKLIQTEFVNWKGKNKQTDDVTIIGIDI